MMRRFTLFFPAAFLTLILFQFAPNELWSFDKTGCEMDCQKCHTITNEDVREILKNLKAPEAEILKVQASPMKGLWEVSIMNKGRPGLFYVDFSKNFVVSGSIVEVKTGKNVTMEKVTQLQQSRRVDFSKIPLGQALVMGDAASPRKVAVFTDPD
jgi:thiol:disulfide interchange protein DsbC